MKHRTIVQSSLIIVQSLHNRAVGRAGYAQNKRWTAQHPAARLTVELF